jgi:hypothetical protein
MVEVRRGPGETLEIGERAVLEGAFVSTLPKLSNQRGVGKGLCDQPPRGQNLTLGTHASMSRSADTFRPIVTTNERDAPESGRSCYGSLAPAPAFPETRSERVRSVESRGGAVALGGACLLPPLSSGGALVA